MKFTRKELNEVLRIVRIKWREDCGINVADVFRDVNKELDKVRNRNQLQDEEVEK